MAERILTNRQGVFLPHCEVTSLRAKGMLNLGIENDLALNVTANDRIRSASAAFHFWSWIAIGIFIGSVYWSFTKDWWWFIIGFFLMRLVWKANTKGTAENLLEKAMVDKEFYDRVLAMEGWMYQVDEANLAELSKYKSE